MLPLRRAIGAAAVAAAFALGAGVVTLDARIARHKPFWLDEGFELQRTCGTPLARLLFRGAHECSPAPLYWIAQSLVVRSVDAIDGGILVKYRAVSLAAAGLTVVALALATGARLGLAAALGGLASLLFSPLFHAYAAENRAYMAWLAVSIGLVIAVAEAGAGGWSGASAAQRARLVAAVLLAGLVAIPGGFQAVAALGACGLAWRAGRTRAGRGAEPLTPLVALGIAVLALDLYYWSRSPCRGTGGYTHYEIGLSHAVWSLVRPVSSLLWDFDAGGVLWLGNLLALLGAAVPVVLWRTREAWPRAERFAFALSAAAVGQVLVAVPVAVGLAAERYLFLPRMFIFLVGARAALVACGTWLVVRTLGRVVPARYGPLAASLAALGAAAGLALALDAAHTTAGDWERLHPARADTIDCDALGAGPLRLLESETVKDFSFGPTFAARLGDALRSCPSVPPLGPRYVLGLSGDEAGPAFFRVSEEAPPGTRPVPLCGAPLALVHEAGGPRRVR